MIPMDHSSGEESEVSDSDIDEHKDKIYAQLQAEKMKVKYGERSFRCPFCLGKKKQDYSGKDLLQHASGIGAATKRKARVRAAHLALAEYVRNDLATLLEPSLQLAIVEDKSPKNEEHKFVWPWMGILVNVTTEWKNDNFVRESEDRLRSQLSRFRPRQVTILWNSKGQIDHSIIKFAENWTGLNDALAFHKHFIVEKYGKNDWNKRDCRKDDLYGWLARSDDYYSPGTIGEHLRKIGVIKSIGDREREGNDRRVALFALQIEEKNKHLQELELKNNQNTMKLDRMIKDKDRLVEEHNEKIRMMQQEACENSRNIIADNQRLHQELESRRKEINRRYKQLEKLATKCNVNRAKIEAEKENNAKENSLLHVATLKKKRADEELMLLVRKHKLEKDDDFNRQQKLQEELDSKQYLEMEIQQLRGKLEVMKHMGDEADTTSEELKKISEELKEKDEQLDYMESANQALIIVERKTNVELEQAKKELIDGLQQNSGTRSKIGVKRVGVLDSKAFCAACKKKDVCNKTAKGDSDEMFAILCSKWEHEIRQPDWHPFKIIDVDGQTKEIVREEDEKLHALKEELGNDAHNLVVQALVELNEYNPSGRYPVPVLWNFKENREAPLDEAVDYALKQWKANKNKKLFY